MSAAPLFADVAEGPADGRAVWLKAADGVRIRAAVWNATGARGTVILLPGRSEYVEKYGRTAAGLAAAGYATLAVDWRGQGLSDRPMRNRSVGHVGDFAEYQADMAAVLEFATKAEVPQPCYLMAHSMGGCIGLRGLMAGLPVRAAVFTAPMWGILLPKGAGPVVRAVTTAAGWVGFDHLRMPTTPVRTLVLDVPFEGNNLTTDQGMWDFMRAQALTHPELTLAGPSLGWMRAALRECAALARLPSPACPMLCAVGSLERIVEMPPITDRLARWPGAKLDVYDGAEHEVLMERPALRDAFLRTAVALFEANR